MVLEYRRTAGDGNTGRHGVRKIARSLPTDSAHAGSSLERRRNCNEHFPISIAITPSWPKRTGLPFTARLTILKHSLLMPSLPCLRCRAEAGASSRVGFRLKCMSVASSNAPLSSSSTASLKRSLRMTVPHIRRLFARSAALPIAKCELSKASSDHFEPGTASLEPRRPLDSNAMIG